MALDNREISLIVWFLIVVGFVLWKTKGNKTLPRLIGILFSRSILTVLGLTAGYIAVCVWLLSLLGCWQWSNLKTTLIWAGGFAFAALFNFKKIESDKAFYRAAVVEALSINAILSFIASSHSFSLPIELALAGTLIFLAVLNVFSDRAEKLKSFHTITSFLLIILALLMLSKSVYHIVTSWQEFTTSHTARELASPILLTTMFLPFLYGIHVYTTYERVSSAFNFLVKDPALSKHVLRRLIAGFRLDLAGLEKWRRHIGLFPPQSTAEINESIDEIKAVRKREKYPHRVKPVFGWLPNHATVFLAPVDLSTNDYHRTYDGWTACSRYHDIGDDLLPSNLAYYVEGDEFVVSKLKLVLSVNVPQSADQAYECFFQTIALLVKSAVPGALSDGNELSISSDSAPLLVNGYELTLE